MRTMKHSTTKSRVFGAARPAVFMALAAGALLASSSHATRAYERFELTKMDDIEIVFDRSTELRWQRRPDHQTRSWEEATTHCQKLVPGASHWRLPTYKELMTLVDRSRTAPALDTTAFPETVFDRPYWTSTAFHPEEASTWYVDFKDGVGNWSARDTPLLTRCVRY